jgi:magnesium-transporting ATPase (P-type)
MLTPPKGRPEWLKYLLQYADPLIVLLIIAGSFTFVAYGADSSPRDRSNLILAVILFFIIWMLCTAKYMNERAAGSVAAKLKNLLPSNTLVRRGGEETSIPAADLVVGDIVHLTIGTRVSADLKIIQSSDLKLDFSSLTGKHFFRQKDYSHNYLKAELQFTCKQNPNQHPKDCFSECTRT